MIDLKYFEWLGMAFALASGWIGVSFLLWLAQDFTWYVLKLFVGWPKVYKALKLLRESERNV